jgi:hypothetical protein
MHHWISRFRTANTMQQKRSMPLSLLAARRSGDLVRADNVTTTVKLVAFASLQLQHLLPANAAAVCPGECSSSSVPREHQMQSDTTAEDGRRSAWRQPAGVYVCPDGGVLPCMATHWLLDWVKVSGPWSRRVGADDRSDGDDWLLRVADDRSDGVLHHLQCLHSPARTCQLPLRSYPLPENQEGTAVLGRIPQRNGPSAALEGIEVR